MTKTIGDCYMAVGGLPEPQPDHAERVASAALDPALSRVGKWLDLPLSVMACRRATAVARVIGRQKFVYDLWGDTVNTASRMETSVGGQVRDCTERVYRQLNGRFTFTPRGEIDIKGKGPMSRSPDRGEVAKALGRIQIRTMQQDPVPTIRGSPGAKFVRVAPDPKSARCPIAEVPEDVADSRGVIARRARQTGQETAGTDPPRLDGRDVVRVVPFVDGRVRLSEVGDGPVELVARAEVRRDGDGIAGHGVGPRE